MHDDVTDDLAVARSIERGSTRVIEDVRASTPFRAELLGVREDDEDFVVTVVLEHTEIGSTLLAADEDEAAVFVADGLQYEVETLSREPWPRCSTERAHSLQPSLVNGQGMWVCADGAGSFAIGRLERRPEP